jgi:hypothetical protein
MIAQGNALGMGPGNLVRPEGAGEFLRPFRAHVNRLAAKTQGVALGWIPSALSAPKHPDIHEMARGLRFGGETDYPIGTKKIYTNV